MKKNTYKIGFIGGGVNSTIGEVHKISCQLDGKWKLVSGFFSRNKKINYKTLISYGLDSLVEYKNIDDYLKREVNNLDAIAILVPTPSRFKILKKVLAYNIPIICEKPLLPTFDEFKKLDKIINKKYFLKVTYNYLGYPLVKELREIISRGILGKIQQYDFEMPQDAFTGLSSKKIKPKKWRLKDNFIPNISHDLGSHLLSFSQLLFKENPEGIFSNYYSHSKKKIIDNGRFFLTYKSGITGNLWISKTVNGIRNGLKIRVFGDKKSAEWLQTEPDKLTIMSNNGSIENIDNLTYGFQANKKKYNRYKVGHASGFLEAFANMYSDFSDDLQDYKQKKSTNKNHNDFNSSYNIAKFFQLSSISNIKKRWIKFK